MLTRLLPFLLFLCVAGCGAGPARVLREGASVSREQARLERQLVRHPDSADRRAELARIRLDAGDVEGAASHAARVLRADPAHPVALRVQLDAAALEGDATVWASAWDALGLPPDAIPLPDDPFAGDAFAAILRQSPEGAAAILRSWAASPDAVDALGELVAAVDRRLFQLYYAADFGEAELLAALARDATGARFVWQKHDVAHAFESRDRRAVAILDEVTGGAPDVIHALAAEFDGRGAFRSASGCWQALARAVEGDERASALLAAADAEYGLGGRDLGRRLVQEALTTTGASAELPARLWRVLERRRDAAFAVELLTEHADRLGCASDDRSVVLRAEDVVAEASLAVDPSPETAMQLRERALRRGEECGEPLFARNTGLRMVASFRYAEAIPLLEFFADARPADAEVVPSLISALEWNSDADGAGRVAAAFVAARLAAEPEPDDVAARAVLDVLRAGSSAAVAGVRADFLRAVVRRVPQNRATTLAWASELERQGLAEERDALLRSFLDANSEGLEARFWVAFWMADNTDALEQTVELLRSLATAPGAVEAPAPVMHRGAWTVAEAAWLRLLDLAPHSSEPDRNALDAVLGFAAARGEASAETWRDIWEGQMIAGWMSPQVRTQLYDRMLAAGFERPSVYSALAIARFQSDDEAGARDAWAAALLHDPAAIPTVLADIERVGALSLALDVLDASGVDDGSARTARMRFDVRLALAGESTGIWEHQARLLALQRATQQCLDRDCEVTSEDAERLDAVGLPGAALAMRRARIEAGWQPGDGGALAILGNLLDLRADRAEITPWVQRLANTSDADVARAARDRLSIASYPQDAAAMARLELSLRDAAGRGGLNALTGTTAWFEQRGRRDDLLVFVDEMLVGPAEALLDPSRSQPANYAFSGNRRQDAAFLLTLAASALSTREIDARAAELAERALAADPDVAGRLRLAVVSLAASLDSALAFSHLERLVGIAGGGIEDFEEAAAAALDTGHAGLAVALLERALASAPDDLALLLALSSACVLDRRYPEAVRAATRLLERLPGGAMGDEWIREVELGVVEPLVERGQHDDAEQVRVQILETRPSDLRELAVAGAEAERGAVDTARRRVDRVVARGLTGSDFVMALFATGFEGLAVDAYERAAPRLSVFEHFDLRMPVGLAWARRHGVAAYVELLRNTARARNEQDLRPWLVEELGYNGMTREAAAWLAGANAVLAPEELLMAVAYDLALGETDRAERSTRRLIELTGPEVPWQALLELWAGRGQAPRLLRLAAQSADDDGTAATLPAEVAVYELLGGEPGPALQVLQDGSVDERMLTARALSALGYRGEAVALLDRGDPAVRDVASLLLGREDRQVAAADLVSRPEIPLTLAISPGLGADALPPIPEILASRARLGGEALPVVVGDGVDPMLLARELARVGRFDEAVRVERAAAAQGFGPRAQDIERVQWPLFAGDRAGALEALAALPDAGRRERTAGDLLSSLDLQLDAALAVELAEQLGGVHGPSDTAQRLLVATHALGRGPEAAALESERLETTAWHPTEVAGLLRAYRIWGQTAACIALAERAAEGARASAVLWSEIALARASVGDELGAIDAIEAGLPMAPDGWRYLQGLGEPLHEIGAWRALDMVARMALELEPEGVEMTMLRAFARLRMGETVAALGDIELATSRPDVNPYWLVVAVEELVRQGLPGEAERLVRRLDAVVWGTASSMRMLEAPSVWSTSALFEWAGLDPGSARAALERISPEALVVPEYARAETLAARVWEGLGSPDAAADAYARRLALSPDDPVLLNNLAYVWAVAGRELELAERLALRSLALAPAAEGSTVDTLGWVQYRQGRLAEAQQNIELALRLEASRLPVGRYLRVRTELASHLAAVREAIEATQAAPSESLERTSHRRRIR